MDEELIKEGKSAVFEWDKRHGRLLNNFIERMNEAQIRFFILRNYQGLPDKNLSKDVDIMVDPKTYPNSQQILIHVFKEEGMAYTYTYTYTFDKAHCFLAMNVEDNWSIHIDLIAGFSNRGFEFLTFNYLYDNTVLCKNFRTLDPVHDGVMLLMYKIIATKQLKKRYRNEIKAIAYENLEEIRRTLYKVLNKRNSDTIIDSLQKDDYEQIVACASSIISSARWKVIARHPCKTICRMLQYIYQIAVRVVWCPSKKQKLIAVEAPDGTGKSTFIDALSKQIAHFFVSEKCTIHHSRPCILPNLGAVGEKAGVMKQDTNFTVPHRAKPANGLSSFVRMNYYWLDYVIGMPIILRKSAKYDYITIFDRYIYDFLVDPERSRIKLPYWMRRMFTRLVKQPKIVFVLQAPADVIYQRKQELTIDEINHQLEGFKKLSRLGKSVHFLDATKAPEEIAKDAVKIILDTFTTKLADHEDND